MWHTSRRIHKSNLSSPCTACCEGGTWRDSSCWWTAAGVLSVLRRLVPIEQHSVNPEPRIIHTISRIPRISARRDVASGTRLPTSSRGSPASSSVSSPTHRRPDHIAASSSPDSFIVASMNSFRFDSLPWSRGFTGYRTAEIIDLTGPNAASDASEEATTSAKDAVPKNSTTKTAQYSPVVVHRPRVSAASRSQSRSSSAPRDPASSDPDGPASSRHGVDKASRESTPSLQDVDQRTNEPTPTRHAPGNRTNGVTPSPRGSDKRPDGPTPSQQSAEKITNGLGHVGPSPRSSPLQRKHDGAHPSKTVSPTLNMRQPPKASISDIQHSHSVSPQQSASRRALRPTSAGSGSTTQVTPRQQQTPRKLDWTVEKIAGRLRGFADDLKEQHNIMIYRMIGENSKKAQERRAFEGEDLFANVKKPPMPEDKALTARIKFKVSIRITCHPQRPRLTIRLVTLYPPE